MSAPRRLPAPFDRTTFRVADAVGHGIDPERLRRTDLAAPVHGVRAPIDSVDFIDAVALVMRPDQFFSHTTAAAIWGAPLPQSVRSVGPVRVSTARDGCRMRRPGVVAHRLDRPRTVEHRGFRVSVPAQMWFECAGVLARDALVAIGDHLVGPAGLATADDLRASIRPGTRFALAARRALDLVRAGAESPQETWLRLAVVEAGFPEPELNVDVHDGAGRFLGRVDMAWSEYRIALEYDGDHHRERDTFRHDQRRDNGFVVNDWLVIHATASDAHRPAVLFERLRQAFEVRAVGSRRLSA
jgi:hypothetical protein